MPREAKKKQLRRCAGCAKVGHNRATCPEPPAPPAALSSPTNPSVAPSRAPLRFFVHHVDTDTTTSPHVVNLKTTHDEAWSHVETNAPATAATHSTGTPTAAPAAQPINYFLPAEEMSIDALIKTRSVVTKSPLSAPNAAPAIEPPSAHFSPTNSDSHSFVHRAGRLLQNIFHPKITSITGAAICIVLLGLIVPSWAQGYYHQLQDVKQTLLDTSTAGFMALQESTTALRQANFTAASDATDRALEKFSTALATLDEHKVLKTLASVVPVVHGEVISREKILLAGDQLALANKQLLAGVEISQRTASTTIGEKIDILNQALTDALPNYASARANLNSVDSTTLPPEYQAAFGDFRTIFSAAVEDFATLQKIATHFHEIFGGEGLRRYLIVFQNENELRPTGGFMGSYALVDVRGGKIVNLNIPAGGTYDVQGQLSVFEEPPTPLTLNNKRWEFQDANWYPDFPSSAEQIMYFYRKSRGVTVDGVIAINSNLLTRLLKIFGPIDDPGHGLTLTHDNAIQTIQTLVESGSEKATGKPKQIIADVAPAFLNSFATLDAHNVLPLLASFEEALQEKEIQLYFTDPETEAVMKQFGWGGAINDALPEQDYLSVINSNVGGQKSDAKIHQTIKHQSVVQSDGSIIDTVTITREHTGALGEPLYGVANTDYVRVYVPQGSQLISANGFSWPPEKNFQIPEPTYTKDKQLTRIEQEVAVDSESGTRITNEFGKTAFGNWVIVDPGSIARVEFSYRLPFTIQTLKTIDSRDSLWNTFLNTLHPSIAEYQLMVQKQSGITSDFSTQIIFPDTWHPAWKTDDSMSLAKNGATVPSMPLTTDKLFGLLMQPDK